MSLSCPSLPSYTGKVERIEVRRIWEEASEVRDMLVGFGFQVSMEKHVGFFLIHWTFPVLTRVK